MAVKPDLESIWNVTELPLKIPCISLANTTSVSGVSTNKPTKPITKPQRQLKVKQAYYDCQGKQANNTQSAISEINFKGKWLNDAGFTADSRVNVQVKRGKLVTTTE